MYSIAWHISVRNCISEIPMDFFFIFDHFGSAYRILKKKFDELINKIMLITNLNRNFFDCQRLWATTCKFQTTSFFRFRNICLLLSSDQALNCLAENIKIRGMHYHLQINNSGESFSKTSNGFLMPLGPPSRGTASVWNVGCSTAMEQSKKQRKPQSKLSSVFHETVWFSWNFLVE